MSAPTAPLSNTPSIVPRTHRPIARPSRTKISPRPTGRPSDLPISLTPTTRPVVSDPTAGPFEVPTTNITSVAPSQVSTSTRPSRMSSPPRPSHLPGTPRPTHVQPSGFPIESSIGPTFMQPSRIPASLNPTPPQVSSGPTTRPSSIPITPRPSLRPASGAPSLPTSKPTMQPTQPINGVCTIELKTTCDACQRLPSIDPVCKGRPTSLVMRYNGGPCADSATTQKISCFDFGTTPTQPGSRVYIVVMYRKLVYFRGWVNVGGDFVIKSPSGAKLGASQSIVIYKSKDLSPGNVLQSLVYVGDCSEPLSLQSHFGASRVVGFSVNGTTTKAFVDLAATHVIKVPPTSASRARLRSLTTASRFQTYNLTSQVRGRTILVGNSYAVNFNLTVDLTNRQEFKFLSTVVGVSSDKSTCSNTSLLTFPPAAISPQSIGDVSSLLTVQGEAALPENVTDKTTSTNDDQASTTLINHGTHHRRRNRSIRGVT
jgi:hypothetical protein